MAAVRTERGLDRLVNFSDATVAIAIMLLVLPLVDAAGDIGDKGLAVFLGEHWWDVLAFLISFAVIARFWVVHHHVFELVRSYSAPLVWLNFLWLVAIVAMPFTTNVLANSEGRPDVYALYIGNMLLTSVVMQLLGWLIRRSPEVRREEVREGMDASRGWAASLLLALSLVLAVLVPSVGMWWLFLLFLSEPLHRLLVLLFPRLVPGARAER